MLLQQLAKTDHQQYEDHYAFTCSAVKTIQEEYPFASDAFLSNMLVSKSVLPTLTQGSTCQISVTSSLLSKQWFLAHDPWYQNQKPATSSSRSRFNTNRNSRQREIDYATTLNDVFFVPQLGAFSMGKLHQFVDA